ncbi:alpha/beta fold hydrolase [Weissella tructae]|uniref:Halo peroxidase n=2 Tax=Weissella TaxID=46255 RepID=A0A075TVK0_9LACO|nr:MULTISPECIES: alpha/beta hydrolase [Weissella]AIG65589.1 Halo peroxidase [Weissella tructae]AIM62904.1 Halo peroxidase [Weissella ceti]AIM64302.1 Halo peroxidase [Weissella ceti]ELA06954.1 non-heme chloride peroxidase [Weissella ceti NC36]QVV90719.1 alpha/beta hydrolase [Weissella tructae]
MELFLNDGNTIYFTDFGSKSAQPIIFIHGFSGRHSEFYGQVDTCLQAGFRVIQVDLRNHGRSSVDPNATISRLSVDIAELIAALELDHVIFIAHSMGAAVTWSYMKLFGTEKIAKIVTIDESPQCLAVDTWPYSLFETTWASVPEVFDHFKQTKMTVNRLPDDIFKEIKNEKDKYAFNTSDNQRLLESHVVAMWQSVIAAVDKPQLFIAGEKSPLWSPEHAEYCANLAKQGSFAIIPNTGHLPHAEAPKAFNEQVISFLLMTNRD